MPKMLSTSHMRDLQRRFFAEKRSSSVAPYSASTGYETREKYIRTAIGQSERRRVAKLAGKSDDEIIDEFNKPVEMTVFSYNGPLDTVMTPRDSILYTKHFLRTGFLSMDPRNGHVKAYVGGPDFRFFQYDMVSTAAARLAPPSSPTSTPWQWKKA